MLFTLNPQNFLPMSQQLHVNLLLLFGIILENIEVTELFYPELLPKSRIILSSLNIYIMLKSH